MSKFRLQNLQKMRRLFLDAVSAISRGDEHGLRLVIQAGVDVNRHDALGRTLLHFCVLFGRVQCVRLLLSKGADQFIMDDNGHNPLQLAISYGALSIASVFDHELQKMMLLDSKAVLRKSKKAYKQYRKRRALKYVVSVVRRLNVSLWRHCAGARYSAMHNS